MPFITIPLGPNRFYAAWTSCCHVFTGSGEIGLNARCMYCGQSYSAFQSDVLSQAPPPDAA